MTKLTLKQARERRALTQSELSELAGVTQSAISKLERGDVPDPQQSTVDALERALGLKAGALVFGAHLEASR